MKSMNNKFSKKYIGLGCFICLLLSLFTGCATEQSHPGLATGAGVRAGANALIGVLAGSKIKGLSKTEGAVGGAVIGGLLGGVMGNQRDATKQQNDSVNRRLDAANQEMNTNGSITPVYLHRSGNQWVGPRGEVYNNIPTQEQLCQVYGF